MFLYRRPLRKEMDVFNILEARDIRAYNMLLAVEGIDVRIVAQKEFSVKGAPGFGEDSVGTPDALYVLVTYQLLNDHYKRTIGTSARPRELDKKDSDTKAKRPRIIPKDAMTNEEVEMATRIIQTKDGPVIETDAKDVTNEPQGPPKVVSLDLFRGATKKVQSVDEILETATDVLNSSLEHAAEALEKAGITPNATKKRYTKGEVAEGVLKELAKGKGKKPPKDDGRTPRKPRKPRG